MLWGCFLTSKVAKSRQRIIKLIKKKFGNLFFLRKHCTIYNYHLFYSSAVINVLYYYYYYYYTTTVDTWGKKIGKQTCCTHILLPIRSNFQSFYLNFADHD